ncbi:hypothetical protein HDG37_005564 [Paraburkholderia sp. MM5384-R2]|nr:hypothetical protein [Paraburkholderia sp. MM5384-R2]
MQLSKIRYPYLAVKHRHVAVWMTRNGLNNYHVAALQSAIHLGETPLPRATSRNLSRTPYA